MSRSGYRLRALVFVAAFAALATAILARPDKRLNDFDQSFYLTIAYDLTRHGVFSNGIFDKTDSTAGKPSPGMFFSPLYPLLVAGVMQVSPRFDAAVACNVQANHGKRDFNSCEIYARPMLLVHAAFLAAGVLAIALAGERMFRRRGAFVLAAIAATAGLAFEAELLSFLMTESVVFGLYSVTAFFALRAWMERRAADWALAGLFVGLLCFARPSFFILVPVIAALGIVAFVVNGQVRATVPRIALLCAAYAGAFLLIAAPWLARNALSIGNVAFSEEYGSAVVIERFAYNDMTLREGLLTLPYCVPEVGPRVVAALAGPDAMARFDWKQKGGFFDTGRSRRDALSQAHERLDPLMGGILRDEYQQHGLRHFAVSVPLAWCGLWVAQGWSLIGIPALVVALVLAARRRNWDYLLYATPPLLMVGVHGALANHYSRYNLILIGPAAIGIAWIATLAMQRLRSREASG